MISADLAFSDILSIVESINVLEPMLQGLSEAQLISQTIKLRQQLATGQPTEAILPEAFTTFQESTTRALGIRPNDVQLIADIALYTGAIAEVQSGEGKLLSAALAIYLHVLSGHCVHMATIEPQQARQAVQWRSPDMMECVVRRLE